MYIIYPDVKVQKALEGVFSFDNVHLFCERNKNVFIELTQMYNVELTNIEKANFKYLIKDSLDNEEYEIEIKEKEVYVYSSTDAGFYYATKTLKQILQCDEIKCVYIKDKPDLRVRGYLQDISRNKVPTVETIKYIIDIMSDLKMNHLELYVEGFSFEYKTFPQYLEDESYITVNEYKEIEKYANDHYIDLVPNQNGFGHMTEWLEKEEFRHLAEAPNGIHLWGTHRRASTLNPLDEGSVKLLEKMYADMLPISNSKYFHMNFDEPFELGKDKTKEVCEKYGVEVVYLDFAKKAYEIIKKYNKIPLIFGDVLINHDNVFDQIPKDMIYVDWGYEAEYPFDKNLERLKSAGIKFMSAPGTTSWCSLLTRTQDYLENISSAIWHVYELGGEGVLLTDWGDIGHLQHLSASLAPIAYAGLLSYRVKHGIFKDLKVYLNNYIFKDKKELAADVFMDAGSYYKYEPHYTGNGTVTFYTLVWILNSFREEDPIQYFRRRMRSNLFSFEQYELLMDFFKQKKKEIQLCEIDELFKKELTHSIEILELILRVNIGYQEKLDVSFRLKTFEEADKTIDKLIEDLKTLWLTRNKYSRLDKSVEELIKVREFIKRSISYYQGGKDETKD